MSTATDRTEAETAVQNYISYLRDPKSFRDEDAIAKKEAELVKAHSEGDIISELVLASELNRLLEVPEDTYSEPFIKHAKSFVETRNLSADVFQHMSPRIPIDVLEKAGFEVKARKAPVTRDQIKKMVKSHDWTSDGFPEGYFTTSAVVALTGAAQATVTHAINELLDDNEIEKTDKEDPTRTGPGSRAKMYCLI